ncbi:hypothetical protein [Desulfosporosinus sp.]|uniref:hypothetical protein n=1 Tax=Desulfosporosinus sp. TaxID=157907 RepID=UPI0025BF9070|nr:hypothetical protein [Desulfosporosinus sp.]MBC2726970.1 hypothetical protein [Desulfosporosinus sp.]
MENRDRLVFKNACDKYGFEYPFLFENYIDLAKEYMLFNNRNRMISLKDAIEETGVNKRGILHAAYDDAVNATLVMQKLISKGWTNDRTHLSIAM